MIHTKPFTVRFWSAPSTGSSERRPLGRAGLATVAAALVAAFAPLAAAQLVNPSFEEPVVADAGSYALFLPGEVIGPGDGTGWTVSSAVFSSIVVRNDSNIANFFPPASDGGQALYIGNAATQSILYQDVMLQANTTYTLTFDIASLSFGGFNARVVMDVLLDSTSILSGGAQTFDVGPGSPAYVPQQLSFDTTQAGTYRIQFLSPDGFGTFVDNFALSGGSTFSCPADFNGDMVLNADDLGDFITGYFNEPPDPRCDFNADGVINADDLGDFITAYFNGC